MLYYMKKYLIIIIACQFCGCSAMRTTGKVAKGVAKAGWGTAKVTGKVLKTTGKVAVTTGKVAVKTGQMTHKGVRTVIYMAKGKQIIPLEKQGDSLYADIRLNRKQKATFLVDTGASSMQISRAMADRLGLNLYRYPRIPVTIAGGHIVDAREVVLKEVRIGRVRVKNVKAIVMEQDNLDLYDGLIGMSFLNHFVFSVDPIKAELILQQRAI
jgi:clan AA aspartic protease (TIGR02281 family)